MLLVRRAKAMFSANKWLMLPAKTFAGRVAFVTGGGTGIGYEISSQLAQLGASVCIIGRRQQVIEASAEKLRKDSANGNVIGLPCDVRDATNVTRSVDECISRLGSCPDLIVNNAAGNFISPTERLSSNAFKTIIDIVLMGTFNVSLDIGKRLIAAAKPGRFLAITTPYAQTGSAYVTPSASAKAGVDTLYKSLAAEWAKYGMRFNCIAPGPIHTEGAFTRLDPTGHFVDSMKSRIGTGRLGELEEIGNLAMYLLSDYSNWMTGQVVTFDGGELNQMSGEMNALHRVKQEEWDHLERMIRDANKKQKSKI